MAAASSRRLMSAIPPRIACSTAAASRRSRACDVVMPQCTIWFMYRLVQREARTMSKLHVEAEQITRAAPEIIWALISDVMTYPRWGPWQEAGYRHPGD